MVRRSRVVSLGIGLALAWSLFAAPAFAVSDRLPDLGMARLSDLRIDNTRDGRRLLRFTTVIVNVGVGPFEVRGSRDSTADATMDTVTQRIYDDGGGHRDVVTAATLRFAGDGHSHWHVWDLEEYTLERLDNGALSGTGAKHGFCFFDNARYRLTLPGAPQDPVYTHCGGSTNLAVTMGLSVGWGDTYPWILPDQYVDITGLTPGTYRLWATADPSEWFEESNDANNLTWVDIQLRGRGNSLKILGYGPAA